jgi:glutamate 5-kinase
MTERKILAGKKRVVVKIGTSSLTYPSGKLNFQRIDKLARVLSEVQADGRQVILVSSGAVAVGSGRMGIDRKPECLVEKQALAAIGQAELIKIYQKFFDEHSQLTAQVLLTRDVITASQRRQIARNTLFTLLEMKIVPIINENDAVSTEEIEFGDNDTLSAYVAELVDADLLILLTDIDGLYSADPKTDPEASIISKVYDINPNIEALAAGSGTSFATGGMATKITAAKICMESCIDMIIANGSAPSVIHEILSGENVGTFFYFSRCLEMKL